MRTKFGVWCIAIPVSCTFATLVCAEEAVSVGSLLRQALVCEQSGDLASSRALLEQALAEEPDSRPAHWQMGFVRHAEVWRRPAQVADRTNTDRLWKAYILRRQSARANSEAQWKLAQWCKTNGLPDLVRGHLLAADHFTPDPMIHRALGRSLHDGQWLTDPEYEQVRRERKEWTKAYQQYKPMMLGLVRQSQSNDLGTQDAVTDAVLAIRDPRAVPAMEDILSRESERLALAVVETLPQITHAVATFSLVRHAVWAQWKTVRTAAINQLRWQDAEHVVPALIAFLQSVESGSKHVGFVHIWYWQDLTTTYVDVQGGRPVGFLLPRQRGFISPSREQQIRHDFSRTLQENEMRIANAHTALLSISGQQWGPNQKEWIDWWQTETGITISDDEPARNTSTRSWRPDQVSSLTVVTAHSCFAAGTPVWTMRGLVAIDKVELGDMVLSQDVTTGELTYRPVIHRTLRPRTEFRTVHVGDDAIRTTAIHPFWVVGKGWMKVKDMTESPMLRAYDGPKPASIADGEPELAYNLEVADFHTYFVGKTGVLVHDVSPITTHGITVPGLVEAK